MSDNHQIIFFFIFWCNLRGPVISNKFQLAKNSCSHSVYHSAIQLQPATDGTWGKFHLATSLLNIILAETDCTEVWYSLKQTAVQCTLSLLLAVTLSGDNRTVSYEIRDLGPQFPKILGTLGFPFSYHIRDSSIKLGTPLQFCKGAVLALHKGAVVAYYTNYTILYLNYTYICITVSYTNIRYYTTIFAYCYTIIPHIFA